MVWAVSAPECVYAGFCLETWLTVRNGELEVDLPKMVLYPDGDGVAEVDVSRFLHDRMATELPESFKNGVCLVKGNRLEYRMTYRASWNEDDVYLKSDYCVVLRGRFPEDAGMSLEEYVREGKNYLSYMPEVMDTVAGSVHYLYFLNVNESGNYVVKVSARYRSGVVREVITGRFWAPHYEVFAIPAGLFHYGFLAELGALANYTVWVEDDQGRLSGKRVLFTVRRSSLPVRVLMFENSLGGLDSVVGYKQKDTLKVERDEFQRSDLITSVVTSCENTVECSSGYITRGMTEPFKELGMSERVWLCDGARVRMVVMVKGSFTVDETGDLYSIEFKYKPGSTGGVFRDYVAPVFRLEAGVIGSRKNAVLEANGHRIEANVNKELRV